MKCPNCGGFRIVNRYYRYPENAWCGDCGYFPIFKEDEAIKSLWRVIDNQSDIIRDQNKRIARIEERLDGIESIDTRVDTIRDSTTAALTGFKERLDGINRSVDRINMS